MEPVRRAVVIEDDDDIRHLLETVLNQAGFEVTARSNGYDGIEAVRAVVPTVVTLDVNMPGIDGFETAKRIRAFSDAYIVMLTALGEEIDTLQGLESGADDYITKPFRPRELRARIEALLRRPRAGSPAVTAPRQDSVGPSFPHARPTVESVPQVAPAAPQYEPAPTPAPPAPRTPVVVPSSQGPAPWTTAPGNDLAPRPGAELVPQAHGDLTPTGGTWVVHRDLRLDPDSRVVLVDGYELELTRTEFDLLATLMESKRRVRSKADLTLVLRGESYVTSYFVGEADKRAIEAHMTNLRRKLGDNPANPRYIETVRGVGYRLTSETMTAP
jgi:DNA-binding response OmpR family regulator